MPNVRSYTDDQLRKAVASASSWGDVMEAIGKARNQNRQSVQGRVRRLQIDASHLEGPAAHERPIIPSQPHPFQGQPHFGAKGRTGLATATYWFLARGYNVSLPVEPAPYDL